MTQPKQPLAPPCAGTNHPVHKKPGFKAYEVSDVLSRRRVRATRPHCVGALFCDVPARTSGNNILYLLSESVCSWRELSGLLKQKSLTLWQNLLYLVLAQTG